jgi:hypothetical protein
VDYVLRKLQRGLSVIEMLFERWNKKATEIRLRPSIFLLDLGPSEPHVTLNSRNISFVNHVNYKVPDYGSTKCVSNGARSKY